MRPVRQVSTDYWVSYADLMGNLLLVFLLVLVAAMAHHARLEGMRMKTIAQQRDALAKERASLLDRERALTVSGRTIEAQRVALERSRRQISGQDVQLDSLRGTLDERERELALRIAELTALRATLDARDLALSVRESELTTARSALVQRDEALALQAGQLEVTRRDIEAKETELGKTRTLLTEQRQRIETLFGVRRSIVESLRKLFSARALKARLTVDEKTGAIRFGEGILFDENQDVLRPDAGPVLREFLDSYLGALLDGAAFRRNLAQIIIEGHTNDNGTYLHNLGLSQRRAQSVLAFLMAQDSPRRALLQGLVTASGRSFSDPILTPQGQVDKVLSRRIEFKFRLKDEETLRDIQKVLAGPAGP